MRFTVSEAGFRAPNGTVIGTGRAPADAAAQVARGLAGLRGTLTQIGAGPVDSYRLRIYLRDRAYEEPVRERVTLDLPRGASGDD